MDDSMSNTQDSLPLFPPKSQVTYGVNPASAC